MKTVLFLCTGNYYRSRFAEHLFNHLAAERGLAWRADSAGLHVQADGVVNVGPMSEHTIERLSQRKLAVPEPLRYPRQVSEEDLAGAELTIALKELEHRPLMGKLHPRFVDDITYWHVHDLDVALPEDSLGEIEVLVGKLVQELAEGATAR